MKVEQFDEKTWEIFQNIRKAYLARHSQRIVWKQQKNINENFVYAEGEEFALSQLENFGAIKRETEPSRLSPTGLEGYADIYYNVWNRVEGKDLVLYIQPRFDEVYNEHKRVFERRTATQQNENNISFCVKKGVGFIKINKEPEIEISNQETRQFKLIQCLCNPNIGITKRIDEVFEAIRLQKDSKDSKLLDSITQRDRKIRLVEWTIKEIQRIKELQGKIKFKLDKKRGTISLSFA